MNRIYNPCKDCPDRFPACSDRCERYKEYKAFLAAEKEFNKTSLHLMSASSGNTSADWTRNIRRKHSQCGRYRMTHKD